MEKHVGTLQVVAAPHPLLSAHEEIEVPAGLTLDRLLEVVQPDPILNLHAHIFLDGELVLREHWAHVKPLPGQKVLVKVVAGGGGGRGKSVLRVVLALAVTAATAGFGAPLGAAIGLSGKVATAVGSFIIGVGGTFLINAIAPIPPPEASGVNEQEKDSPTFSIEAARNALRPFAPIPVVLGKHRHVPPLGAATYTELMGQDQFLRMLVVWGYGPLLVTDLKIGETPIGDFQDVEVEHREGRSTDPPLTLYTNSVHQDNFSILLSEPDSWTTRRSQADSTHVSLDFTAPQGVFRFNDDGSRASLTVNVEIEYRKVGTAAWLAASNPIFSSFTNKPIRRSIIIDLRVVSAITVTNGGAGYTSTPTVTIAGTAQTAATATATVSNGRVTSVTVTDGGAGYYFEGAVSFSGGGGSGAAAEVTLGADVGQYDVRVRRTTPDTISDKDFDEVFWTVLRSFEEGLPIAFDKPLALTALRIKATDQLSGAVDTLNAVVSALILDWNGSNWVERETSNPASIFRHVLQGPARSDLIPDSRVDLLGLEAWHDFCDTNDYECNGVVDYRASLQKVLSEVAGTGRASPAYADGKWGVVVDTGTQTPVQHFTPRNSYGFQAERAFGDIPHALRMRFKNRDEDWRLDERIVYGDNYDATNAERFATLEARKITDPDHVFRFGRFQLAQILLRREQWSFEVDFEYMVAGRGDRVVLTHDAILVGQKSSRIKSLETNAAGDVTGIELDEEVTFETSHSYGVSIRTPGNVQVTGEVTAA